MASIPSAISTQTLLNITTPVEVALVPSSVTLGTASVRVLNAGTTSANFTLWFVPAGQSTPLDVHLIQFEHPLNPKASNIDFGIAVNAGDRFFVRTTGIKTVVLVNIVAHQQS